MFQVRAKKTVYSHFRQRLQKSETSLSLYQIETILESNREWDMKRKIARSKLVLFDSLQMLFYRNKFS